MINNHFLNKDEIFLTTMCAFPSASLERTSNSEALDQSERIWNKFHHNPQKMICLKEIPEFLTKLGKRGFTFRGFSCKIIPNRVGDLA